MNCDTSYISKLNTESQLLQGRFPLFTLNIRTEPCPSLPLFISTAAHFSSLLTSTAHNILSLEITDALNDCTTAKQLCLDTINNISTQCNNSNDGHIVRMTCCL